MVNWLNRLTFPAGAENHKADGEDGQDDADDYVPRHLFAEDQGANQNGCEGFEDSHNRGFGGSDDFG